MLGHRLGYLGRSPILTLGARSMSRAIRIDRFGGPETLRVVEVDVPSPRAGQVRLRHTAIGLNMIDTYYRSGLYALTLPSGLGSEGAGVVVEAGAGVRGLTPGKPVPFGRPPTAGRVR